MKKNICAQTLALFPLAHAPYCRNDADSCARVILCDARAAVVAMSLLRCRSPMSIRLFRVFMLSWYNLDTCPELAPPRPPGRWMRARFAYNLRQPGRRLQCREVRPGRLGHCRDERGPGRVDAAPCRQDAIEAAGLAVVNSSPLWSWRTPKRGGAIGPSPSVGPSAGG